MPLNTSIRQRDAADCGAACLASVAAHYGLLLPLARVRQHTPVTAHGTDMPHLLKAAAKLGLEARGVQSDLANLAGVPLPAIAPIVLNEDDSVCRYVVIYRVGKRRITYLDPADGRRHRLRLADFAQYWTGTLLLARPDASFEAGNHKKSVLGRFWELVQPHGSIITQALVGSVLYTVLGLAMSVFVQKIVDHVLVDGNRNLLNLLGLGMVVLLVFQVFLGTMKSLFALQTGQQIDARLTLGYYNHLLRLPQTFFDSMRVGEIISRLDSGIKVRAFVNETALNLLVNLFIVVLSFGLMFTYYWKLAALMSIILPLYAGIYWVQNHLNRRSQRRLMEQTAEMDAQLVESVTGMGTIKRLGMESFASERTEARFMGLMRAVSVSGRQGILSNAATEFVSQLFRIGLLWVGSYFVLDHELTPGELLSFYAIVGYFAGPATALMGANKSVQDALIAADRMFEVIDLEAEAQDQKTELTPELAGDVVLHNVSFAYHPGLPVLRGLSLRVQRGSITGIVGESGAGKTTLLSLLQGLYPVEAGSITIGGLDVRHLHLGSLRRVVGIVPQQIDLFSGSVADNITIGDPLPDMARVITLCRELGVLAFIEQLPHGFATQLGERGAGLSGGQKQRLALARALYRNPEILILDEATSSMDAAAEHYVHDTLLRLRDAGKTIIIIAHRLSTVAHADKIVVLADGQVKEEGAHAQLLHDGGAYAGLWQQLMPGSAPVVPVPSREAATP
ncbi:peptidase domain-containing ABC transporter [Hymenobacter elongatus]|uniref:peptidase domain-containing ABC transporter n=1 Tax=Hymenobacter elongatus TaxID=877208 RepID=UPI001FDA542B|nr:peptidase domain-containing ABC transporter [Hymenobacter elongatus]